MVTFLKKYKVDILLLLFLTFTLPLFFYKLGQSSLVSFDEAWYAEIAKNILKTNDPINLTWNGNSYIDHPPAGFWLMAASMKIIGDGEFAVRFTAAFLGFLSLVVIYFLGKELFSRVVGFCSALAFSSSFWFLFRARSGNLDIPLTFFFLLSLLLAWKSSTNKKFLLPWSISLIFLLLTKTLVPLTILPSLIIIFWKSKLNLKDFLWSFSLVISVAGGWFLLNIIRDTNFIGHYLGIGLPGIKTQTNYWENLKLMKEYLHFGIGKWFWPGIMATFLSLVLRQKRFLCLSVFFLTFFLPFIFSQKGHIWHLIPLYPILTLSFFGFSFVVLKMIIKNQIFINGILLVVAIAISLFQIKIVWRQFINIPAFISDEAILSRETANLPGRFFIDGDFVPAAVYYSGKQVSQITTDGIKPLFEQKGPFTLITKEYRLVEAGLSKTEYKIIKSDRDKILIFKKS